MRNLAPLVLCLAACASSGRTAGETTTIESIRIADAGSALQTTAVHSDGPMTYEVSAPVDALWKVLPAVYDSLGIAINRREPASHTLGHDGLRLRRRLGKVPLQRYLDCGSSQGGPNAESYDIHLAVRTQLQPGAAGHSRLSTTVQAQARPINFAGEWVRCTSKNLLEQRIAEIGMALVR